MSRKTEERFVVVQGCGGLTQTTPQGLTLQCQDERLEVRLPPETWLSHANQEGTLSAAVLPQDLVRPLNQVARKRDQD